VDQLRLLILVIIVVFGRCVSNADALMPSWGPNVVCRLRTSRGSPRPSCGALHFCGVLLAPTRTAWLRPLRRSLAPFVQLHLFIFVLLLSAAVSVMLQPHAWAGQMDLLSMSSIAFLMFMSLYFIGYSKQPSGAARAHT
jgi:hypothetical protein